MPRPKRSISIAVLSFGLVVAACSPSSGEATTTTAPAAEVLEQQMCRTLALLNSVGANGPGAANALRDTDLVGATGQEMVAYGDLLIAAPRSVCPVYSSYAEEIAYWLGF